VKNTLARQTIAAFAALAIFSSTFMQAAHSDTMVATQSAAEHQYDVSGTGWLDKLMCIGCATTLLLAGGSSVVGLVMLAGTVPAAVLACVQVCVEAYS